MYIYRNMQYTYYAYISRISMWYQIVRLYTIQNACVLIINESNTCIINNRESLYVCLSVCMQRKSPEVCERILKNISNEAFWSKVYLLMIRPFLRELEPKKRFSHSSFGLWQLKAIHVFRDFYDFLNNLIKKTFSHAILLTLSETIKAASFVSLA